jgi:hypothetical protein
MFLSGQSTAVEQEIHNIIPALMTKVKLINAKNFYTTHPIA